jgi:Protein of unknown function (DUF998)
VAQLAGTRPNGWAQIATFVITGLLIDVLAVAVREELPPRPMSGLAVVLLALLGVALMLAAFRVDAPMLRGGDPATWNGWLHGIAFLLIIATGVLAPLTMALAVRHDPNWRPIAIVSLAASALFTLASLGWALCALVAAFARRLGRPRRRPAHRRVRQLGPGHGAPV